MSRSALLAGMDERAAETAGAVEAARVCFGKSMRRAAFHASAVYERARQSVPARHRIAYLEAYFQQVWREAQRSIELKQPRFLLYVVDDGRDPLVVEYREMQLRNGRNRPAALAGWAVYRERKRYATIAALIVAQHEQRRAA